MLAVGTTAAWFGYSVFYYGLTQVQGGNWGYRDLVWPSLWALNKNVPRDDGTTPQAAQQSALNQLNDYVTEIKDGAITKLTKAQKSNITKLLKKIDVGAFGPGIVAKYKQYFGMTS